MNIYFFSSIIVILEALTITKGPQNVTVEVSDDVELTCEFFSQLQANVEWFFNGGSLPPSLKVETMDNISTVFLSNINTSNSGEYTCQLDNGVENTVNASAYVTVGEIHIYINAVELCIAQMHYWTGSQTLL